MTLFIRTLLLALMGSATLSLSGQTLVVRAGPADSTMIPKMGRMIQAAVVTPGLIAVHSVLGLSGLLNQPHDQDQLDKSAPCRRTSGPSMPTTPANRWYRLAVPLVSPQ